MRRRKCKGNYAFNVKFILSESMCCRLSARYNSININNIQGITIIHLTYVVCQVIIYLTLMRSKTMKTHQEKEAKQQLLNEQNVL